MASRNALTPGTLLRQYKIKNVLGQGGFGITYLAHDQDLDREVAIKECYPRDFVEREGTSVVATSSREKTDFTWALDKFVDEATTLAKFKHPGIVQILQILKEENGTAYIVLEYVEGKSLSEWLKGRNKPPNEKELQEIIKPIFEALQAVHEKNYAHRDIAPDNIFIRPNGDAVLLDFGAAKQIIGQYSRTMNLIVKDGYSAPEQYYTEGKQGPWTDVYALSATLYRIISGKRPVDAMARQDAKSNEEPDPLPNLTSIDIEGYSKSFLESVMSGMTVTAKNRPQSLDALREKILGSRSGVIVTNNTDDGNSNKKSNPLAKYLVAATMLLSLAGASGYLYYQHLEDQKILAEQARQKAELNAWEVAEASDTRNGYENFMSAWPTSNYSSLAQLALEKLSKTWTKVIKNDGSQKATSVATNNERAVVAGWTSSGTGPNIQSLVYAFSLSGKQKWQAEYGDVGNEIIEDVLLQDDNSVLVVGHHRLSPSKPLIGFIISYSPSGEIQWQQRFEVKGLKPVRVSPLPNGNLIIAGTIQESDNTSSGWIAELNASGEIVKTSKVQNTQSHEISDFQVLQDGNLAAVGNILPAGRNDKNFWFARMTKSGEIITERNAGGPKLDTYNAVALNNTGELITVGESRSFSKDNLDAIAVRVASNNKMTPKPMLLKKDDQLVDVAASNSKDVFLAGTTNSLGSGKSDGWLMKYDLELKKLHWQRVIGADGWDAISSVSVMEDGSALIVGNTDILGGGSSDIMIVRIDKDGNYEALPK